MTKELTDEVIKKKHKEFDDDIQKYLSELRSKNEKPDIMAKLRDAGARLTARKPMSSFLGQGK